MGIVATAPELANHSEGDYTIAAAEIFQAGTFRGKDYTDADLDRIVENFNRFSTGSDPLLAVPLVLGHEEQDEQELLNNTGLPAAGWIGRLWRDGHDLWAEFAHVAPIIARLIIARRYRTVSAEIYDRPPDGVVGGQGMMLRRVALLGGDIPQIKTLPDVPLPEKNSEPVGRSVLRVCKVIRQAGSFAVFSEVETMADSHPGFDKVAGEIERKEGVSKDRADAILAAATRKNNPGKLEHAEDISMADESPTRDDMLKKLADAGYDTSLVTPEAPDSMLAETLRVIGGQQDDADAEANRRKEEEEAKLDREKTGEVEDNDEADGDGSTTNMDDEPVKATDPDSARKALAYACKKMNEYCGTKMDDKVISQSTMGNVTADSTPPKDPPVKQYSEEAKEMRTLFQQFKVELKAARKEAETAKREAHTAVQFAETEIAARRKGRAEAEIELLIKEGRLPPALKDTMVAAALRQPHDRVETFVEGGKTVKATPFDRFLNDLKKAPPQKHFFGEKVKTGGSGTSSADEEVAKVETHWDNFAEQLTNVGTTKESMVRAFKRLREQDKTATAEAFLNPRSVVVTG